MDYELKETDKKILDVLRLGYDEFNGYYPISRWVYMNLIINVMGLVEVVRCEPDITQEDLYTLYMSGLGLYDCIRGDND